VLAPIDPVAPSTVTRFGSDTGAASFAVLERLLAERALDPDGTICVIVSETGLKTEAAAPSRRATAFDAASLRRLVEERLGRSPSTSSR